jgi:hypothetical protein
MNNFKLKNLTDDIFYWDMRKTTLKKIGCKLNHQVWNEIEWPITHQLEIPIARPIYKTIEKEYE